MREKEKIEERIEGEKEEFDDEKEKIRNLSEEVKEKTAALEEMKKRVVSIIEYFYRSLDAYEKKVKEANRIEEEKENIYRMAKEKQ